MDYNRECKILCAKANLIICTHKRGKYSYIETIQKLRELLFLGGSNE